MADHTFASYLPSAAVTVAAPCPDLGQAFPLQRALWPHMTSLAVSPAPGLLSEEIPAP